MKKKGFTLVEIIVCIGVLAILGVVSILGINYVSKNIKISKLKDIEDEIMIAAKIYLEVNDEVNERVYNNKEGVIVPLKNLVEEGLLDLSMTDLDMDDINGEYIVAALGNDSYSSSEPCVDLKALTSWEESSSQKIYLCTKTDGSVSIQGSGLSANNYSAVTREPIDFSQEYKYVVFKDVKYRLLRLDSDDSLTILNWGSFGETFKGKVLPIYVFDNFKYNCNFDAHPSRNSEVSSSLKSAFLVDLTNENSYKGVPHSNITTLGYSVICKTGEPGSGSNTNKSDDFNYNAYLYASYNISPSNYIKSQEETVSTEIIVYSYVDRYTTHSATIYFDTNEYNRTPIVSINGRENKFSVDSPLKKIRLKPCMKIVSGTGGFETPYELKDTCGG